MSNKHPHHGDKVEAVLREMGQRGSAYEVPRDPTALNDVFLACWLRPRQVAKALGLSGKGSQLAVRRLKQYADNARAALAPHTTLYAARELYCGIATGILEHPEAAPIRGFVKPISDKDLREAHNNRRHWWNPHNFPHQPEED